MNSNRVDPEDIKDDSSSSGDNSSDSSDEVSENGTRKEHIPKCCLCIKMNRAPCLIVVVAILEIFYLFYNTGFGIIFYSVGRSTQIGVTADGQLAAGATANKYN
jgi:hypothetical protein